MLLNGGYKGRMACFLIVDFKRIPPSLFQNSRDFCQIQNINQGMLSQAMKKFILRI